MNTFYRSYIRAFVKFAQSALDNRMVKTLSLYAIIISNKANELIQRAALNSHIELAKLRKEMFELGKEYVHKFGKVFKEKNGTGVL